MSSITKRFSDDYGIPPLHCFPENFSILTTGHLLQEQGYGIGAADET